MIHDQPILSFCMTCRDGHEAVQRDVRGGCASRPSVPVAQWSCAASRVRAADVQCMSPCTRSCIVSLSAGGRFSCMIGDLSAAEPGHVEALRDLIPRNLAAQEGFLRCEARPKPLRARILGHPRPPGSSSDLVISIEEMSACSVRTGMQRRGARPEKGNPALEGPCHT